ncbi:MAG: hypothetical protein QXL86_00330 [Candidatus Aenigmatarchaeota archaeon]
MEFKILLVSAIVFLFLVLEGSLAEGGVSLTINPKTLTVYTTEIGVAELTIKNNQAVKDSFVLSVFPPYHFGIIPSLEKYSVTLNPGESTKIKVSLEIPECAEEKPASFSITARSLSNDEVIDSESLILEIVRKYGVCIYDFKLSDVRIKPGKSLGIDVVLMNPSESISQPVSLQTNIYFKNEIVKRFDKYIEAVEGKKTEIITSVFETSKYQTPGRYLVEVLLKDRFGTTLTRKTSEFIVETVNASESLEYLPITKTTRYGILTQTVEITIKNEGNVPVENFYLSEQIPIFMKVFFFPRKEPEFEEIKDNRIVYSWLVPLLVPGSSYTITYEISTWNAVLIAVVLIIIIVYSFANIFNISLEKKHKFVGPITKDKEITIMLEVKNRTRNEIRDVVVRDFVPGIATVVEKFDTLRPTLRKIANGTEIVWKIPSLAPGDERVLTYRIKPIVDVIGTLKLPKAYLKFMDKKKEVKKILSKTAYIKAG